MKKHIMVVDDSKTIRNLVAFVLKGEGFKVSTAEDGLDAIEKLYSLEPVDLIVSDVNMPRMDGFTFIKTIRAQDAYKDIPIIVLSTEGQEKDIQTGMRAFIFDLDGTLVDSLEDIGQACNDVLASHGYPVHPLPAYRFYVGRGFHKLVNDALPEGEAAKLSSDQLTALIAEARARYGENMRKG